MRWTLNKIQHVCTVVRGSLDIQKKKEEKKVKWREAMWRFTKSLSIKPWQLWNNKLFCSVLNWHWQMCVFFSLIRFLITKQRENAEKRLTKFLLMSLLPFFLLAPFPVRLCCLFLCTCCVHHRNTADWNAKTLLHLLSTLPIHARSQGALANSRWHRARVSYRLDKSYTVHTYSTYNTY